MFLSLTSSLPSSLFKSNDSKSPHVRIFFNVFNLKKKLPSYPT